MGLTISPMTIAAQGSTNPAAGVMTTRPATRPGRRADERALPHRDALGKHPGKHAGRAGRHGVQQREPGHAVGRELAARVEPKPAEPQKRRAQGHERHIVGTVGQHGEALATPQHEAQDESGEARGDVHHVAAGEVQGPDHGRR